MGNRRRNPDAVFSRCIGLYSRTESCRDPRLNFHVASGFDPDFVKSYDEHYAFVNPWLEAWEGVPSGTVLVSERFMPARTFADSEFYNDWILPQKTIEGAAGISFKNDAGELLYIPVHYPLHLADDLGDAIGSALARIRPALVRARAFAELLASIEENAVVRVALGRNVASVVVDSQCRLKDANDIGADLLRSGVPFVSLMGRLALKRSVDGKDMGGMVRAVLSGACAASAATAVCTGTSRWLVEVHRLPSSARFGPFVNASGLALVTARIPDQTGKKKNLQHFSKVFGLTPAETEFCRRLGEGHNLTSTAGIVGITRETARQRLKTVFQKTGTSRQAELCVLIERWALGQSRGYSLQRSEQIGMQTDGSSPG